MPPFNDIVANLYHEALSAPTLNGVTTRHDSNARPHHVNRGPRANGTPVSTGTPLSHPARSILSPSKLPDPIMYSSPGAGHYDNRVVEVVLLSGQTMTMNTSARTTVRNIFDRAIRESEIKEPAFFGLANTHMGPRYFLTMDDPIWHYWGKRDPESVVTVYLLVEFYVENVSIIRHVKTRHAYYQQVFSDVVSGYISQVPPDIALHLGSVALQAHYGDVDLENPPHGYFEPESFFPMVLVENFGRDTLLKTGADQHAKYKRLPRVEAEKEYLKQVQVCITTL